MKQNCEMNLSHNSVMEIHVTFVVRMVYDSKNGDRPATSDS